MARIRFSKMQGLGNDFVVIDAVRQSIQLTAEQVRQIADRRFGIGCDQLLLVESPRTAGVHFRYRIFNADGSEVQQCGNGARCFARFVREQGLSTVDELVVETASGVIRLWLTDDQQVRVNMGIPQFDPATLPFLATLQTRYQLTLAATHNHPTPLPIEGGAVSMGNPHFVIPVAAIDRAPVTTLGPRVERHPAFPERVNVGFMQHLAADHIALRVWERGSGETLACGTGACAAVAVGRHWAQLAPSVRVDLPGGTLQIDWSGHHAPLWMTGPAVTVFEGTITL